MSYRQFYRPDLNLVYTGFGETVTLDQLRRCAVETYRDTRYRAAMRELFDFRATTAVDPQIGYQTLSEIWELQSGWVRNLRQGGQVVLVAPGDLVFGLCRIYTSLGEQTDLPITPCRDWEAACALLDIDPRFAELNAHRAET